MPEMTPTALGMSWAVIFLCTLTSLAAGVCTALTYTFRHAANKNFVITLALLPVIVQSIIMLVNGRVGTGIAVMGAFSLVRFRSIPGTAKEITSIFLAVALGLATGTAHIWYALIFMVVINGMILLFSVTEFGETEAPIRNLKIVIPENKDYTGMFTDLFAEYTSSLRLERVRTVNLGSLYELQYTIILKDIKKEKEFIDKMRARNSNLEISCGRTITTREEL
jgi:hypothetical protein